MNTDVIAILMFICLLAGVILVNLYDVKLGMGLLLLLIGLIIFRKFA